MVSSTLGDRDGGAAPKRETVNFYFKYLKYELCETTEMGRNAIDVPQTWSPGKQVWFVLRLMIFTTP